MKWIRLAAFGVPGLLIAVMTAATFLEKVQGTDFVSAHIYHHPVFIGLWAATAVCGTIYIFRRKLQRNPITLLVHLALVTILAGALTTHLWGEQGSIHLRTDGSIRNSFTLDNGNDTPFPFQLQLKGFRIDYYPGTRAPMDFVSELLIHNGDAWHEGQVSMNHIYTYRHYRFYQSAYDADGNGTTLSVSHDPYGIAVTYTGYTLLAVSLILFFVMPGTGFRTLLHHPLLHKGSLACLLVACGTASLHAEASPRTIPRETAETMGNLYVYYNDRVCPLQTLARDFTLKLYGSTSYKGLTAEQVLAGWLFYYDAWKSEPMFRIKNSEVKRLLGIKGKYACLNDFIGPEGYKLEQVPEDDGQVSSRRNREEANEKFNLASMAAMGNLLKLYPFCKAGEAQPHWYSPADKLPAEMPYEQGQFVHKCLNLIAEQIARKDFEKAGTFLEKIKSYQEKELGVLAPSSCRFQAEKVYNRMNYGKPLAIGCIVLGIMAFIYYCRRMVSRPKSDGMHRTVQGVLTCIMAIVFIYLCAVIALRGYIGGHLPLSNGYETMQFMALCALVLTFFFRRKFEMATAFGLLVCGLALLVAMLGESNPPVTPLMPVLASPLLSAHVVSIMLAYSLLAFVMLNGVTAAVLHGSCKNRTEEIERLYILSRILLYPAVALLALGIFIGAVWANVSWGRYWGWDPKEVWALITLLVYAAALHPASLPAFRRAMFLHWFSIVAFLSVLITYFGVNFLMGGMHSYA